MSKITSSISEFAKTPKEERGKYAGVNLNDLPKERTKEHIKLEAMAEAYKLVYRDMYRSIMRHSPREMAEALGLVDHEVQDLEYWEDRIADSQKPVKYVVINLPPRAKKEYPKYKAIMERVVKKCYVGKYCASYELGKTDNHPHFNLLFESTVQVLETNRIVRELSTMFDIDRNFIDVQHCPRSSWRKMIAYVQKENIDIWDNYSIRDGKSKKYATIMLKQDSDPEDGEEGNEI